MYIWPLLRSMIWIFWNILNPLAPRGHFRRLPSSKLFDLRNPMEIIFKLDGYALTWCRMITKCSWTLFEAIVVFKLNYRCQMTVIFSIVEPSGRSKYLKMSTNDVHWYGLIIIAFIQYTSWLSSERKKLAFTSTSIYCPECYNFIFMVSIISQKVPKWHPLQSHELYLIFDIHIWCLYSESRKNGLHFDLHFWPPCLSECLWPPKYIKRPPNNLHQYCPTK